MPFGFSRRNTNIVRPSHHQSCRPAPKRRRLFFDSLEDRRMLSAAALTAAGPEFPISAPGISGAAMDNAGNAAAVWMSPDANGDGNLTLNYQYYSNGSGGLTPTTFAGHVATGVVASSQGNVIGIGPVIKVAMAPEAGEFVVLWQTSADTNGTTTFKTFAQAFNPTTQTATAPITVGSGSDQAAAVAMNDNGFFDVLYDARASKGLALTATVQQYNSAGQAQGSPISVVPITYGTGSIGIDDARDFVVTWDAPPTLNGNPDNYYHINAERYSSTGQIQGSVIQANPNLTQWPLDQEYSSVSMDPVTGNFVVAWQQFVPNPTTGVVGIDDDLVARQFNANGTPVEANSVISMATATFDTYTRLNPPYTVFEEPSGGLEAGFGVGVAAVPGGSGAFDVTWANFYRTLVPSGSTTGSGWLSVDHQDIYGKIYDSLGDQTQWLAMTNDGQSGGWSAAVDSNNDLLVLFNDAGQLGGQLYKPNPQAAGGFAVSSSQSNVTAGTPFDVTVTAPAGYSGTVYLASSAASIGSDPSQHGLPASITFQNGGSATIQVALETAGQQTLTATTADGSSTASATVDVAPAAAARFAVTALDSNSVQAGTPITSLVTALDAYGNVATGYNGTIQLSSTDSTATLPSSLTLVNGVANFTATFNATTQGSYYITATDPTGSVASGTSMAISVYPAPTKHHGH